MKEIVQALLPPALLQGARATLRGARLVIYNLSPSPWTHGYNIAKHNLIRATLADPGRMAPFRERTALPRAHGRGIDERCVEYPWLYARLMPGPGAFLDAGSALNFDYLLSRPELASKGIAILTLAPERDAFWQRGISYVYGDLRHAPLRDGYYDAVACISTLEHVGCDNSIYTGKTDNGVYSEGEMAAAVCDMWRMLKEGGTLYITVPFGVRRNYGSFQQFDSGLLDKAIAQCVGAAPVERSFFRYGVTGWQWASEGESSDAVYVDWICRAADDRGPRPREPDGGAAARAVACLALTKPART